MGQTLHFKLHHAKKAGIVITKTSEQKYVCSEDCSCNSGADYCDREALLTNVKTGYKIETPTGLVGYSFLSTAFDCKSTNQELKSWFLNNVKGAHVSY